MSLRVWLAALVVVLASCGSPQHARTTEPVNAVIADRLPRVEYHGGPFLRRPRVVTITFAGDDAAGVARLERFGHVVTRSRWWRAVTDGYCARPGDCIGPGRSGRAVRLSQPLDSEMTEDDLEQILTPVIADAERREIDRDTLLLVYLPDGVSFTDPLAGRYCGRGPRALHSAIEHDSRRIAYAVVPRCGDEADVTTSASHEILEATTNPDPARHGFAFRGGAESGGFTASGGQPFLALAPREPAVRLPEVGDRSTLELHATADRATQAWQASAVDLNTRHGRKRCVEATLDRSTVEAGDAVALTVILRSENPQESCVVGLVSTLDGTEHLWPLTVSTR